jgi:hypothetical protein
MKSPSDWKGFFVCCDLKELPSSCFKRNNPVKYSTQYGREKTPRTWKRMLEKDER